MEHQSDLLIKYMKKNDDQNDKIKDFIMMSKDNLICDYANRRRSN